MERMELIEHTSPTMNEWAGDSCSHIVLTEERGEWHIESIHSAGTGQGPTGLEAPITCGL